jgi:hypothetical protein
VYNDSERKRMAAEEDDLDTLHSEMAKVVGPAPAVTLMRHLSPAPWPDVATKADVAEAQAATTADIATLKIDVDDLKVGFGELKADVGELKADVGELKADVGELKADVGELKVDVGELKVDVGELKVDVGELRNDFVRLDAATQVGFANLEASLIQKLNTQTITMIFALVAVVASISSVALFR